MGGGRYDGLRSDRTPVTPLELVLDKLPPGKWQGGQYRTLCPAHDDHHPSLDVKEGDDGRVLFQCRSRGCASAEIAGALGLEEVDLFPKDPSANGHAKREIRATYDYTDEGGDLLFQVVRFEPKDFRQRRPDGRGDWIWKTADVRKVLYRLEQVLDTAGEGGDVWVCEGERDVQAAEAAGVVATTNPGGAGKWRPEYTEALRGAVVIVVADRDDAGRNHARAVAADVEAVAREVHVVEPAHGKDLSDHLAAGLDMDALVVVAPTVAEVREAPKNPRIIDGATFILDAPAEPPALWGDADAVLWAKGEPFLLVGPTGVGKSTLAAQLTLARAGLLGDVLGLPVKDSGGRGLYLACDRPAQIRRVFIRLAEHLELDRAVLAERLAFWSGPPPHDFAQHPDTLTEMCREAGADWVWIDSLKDVAIGLNDDAVGAGLNRALQTAVAEDIDVAAPHHQRKGQGGARPRTLEDVYGSTWITAGAGSVVLLWGVAGDPIVELVHLKQPAAEVGPWKVAHDHVTGLSEIHRGAADPLVMLRHTARGLTTNEVAVVLFETTSPTDNERRKAQYRLDKLVDRKLAYRREPERGGTGGATPARYFAVGGDPTESREWAK